MPTISAMIVDAFTRSGTGGNPAGVVFDDDNLTEQEMQSIAAELGLSETAFVRLLNDQTASIRFFTPTSEVPLCGHATIAAHHALLTTSRILSGKRTMLTPAGPQSIDVSDDGLVTMTQNKPVFGPEINADEVALSLGLRRTDLHPRLPIQMASTGLHKIFVPLSSLNALQATTPDLNSIHAISIENGAIGMYCYALETRTNATAHCRNFAPVVGIHEDAATGTSAAALSCLLHRFGELGSGPIVNCRYEQGDCIGRPSELLVRLLIENDAVDTVWVSGRANQTELISLNRRR